jgi:hypothetical protein
MEHRDMANGLIPVGELFVAVVFDDEENRGPLDNYWNDECIKKMLQPVATNGHLPRLTTKAKKNFVAMAWYYDWEPEEAYGFWDEAAIRKMREPVAHGFQIFLAPEKLSRLAELA